VQPAEIFYKKAIIVERGSFRPVTYATNDMLEGARKIFLQQPGAQEEDLIVLMEMTLENLLSEGQLNHADFLARIDTRSLTWVVRAAGLDEYLRCTLTAVGGGELEFSRCAVVAGVAQPPVTCERRPALQ